MNWLVELENITKRYSDVTALQDVNLKIRKGEIFTLMGPNGSGKTTMLRIMAGLDKPTSGEIYFDEVKVNDSNRRQIRNRSTMVFQKPTVFNTTVYDNISYGLNVRKHPRKETNKKVSEVLKLVKLEGYERRPAKKLSGGEQQRVSLARALVLNPELLLLDEPTANLDPVTTSIIEETISYVNREFKTTVVIATHNMFQAESVTERVALLLGGKIAEIGTVSEIFRKPSRVFTSFARLENVFSGFSRILGEGTSLIDVGCGVYIEAALKKSGKATIYVRPEDVILSKKLITSSARNLFKGKIVEISDIGSVVKLKVDAGKDFVVQITKRSFTEMQFNVGSAVFLTFKASSVHMV